VAAIVAVGLSAFISILPGPAGIDTLFAEQGFFGVFGNASRISIDVSGQIYVLDGDRHTVSRFGDTRAKTQTIGGFGWDVTTFDRPTAVATDGLNVYVSDYGNHRVVRYDRNLVFLSSLATRDTSFVPAQFGYPLGLALSRQGDLFVLDGENLKIVQFDSRSGFVRSFGTLESQEGRLHQPIEIAVTQDDRVLVLEADRVVEFDFTGTYLRSIGEGVIRNSAGLCAMEKGFLVAANDTLLWFNDDRSIRMRIAASTIIAEFPLSPLRDVAVWKDQLFLLTPSRIGVFRMEAAAR